MGAATIITSVLQLCLMPLHGLTQGAQPITSFNYGAQNYDRVRKTYRLLIVSCLTVSTLIWLSVMLFPRMYIAIFTETKELADYTVGYMRLFMGAIFMMGLQLSCQQTFLALGKAKVSVLLACLRKIILMIPLIFILGYFFQTNGVFAAEPVADALAATTTFIVFLVQIRHILPKTGKNEILEEK